MSLLDYGPDVVTVFVEAEVVDDYGNRVKVPSATGVTVRGRWQPSTSEESADLGQQAHPVYRFVSRTFPGGPFARVEFDAESWDVIGVPREHRGSYRTQHVTTYLKQR